MFKYYCIETVKKERWGITIMRLFILGQRQTQPLYLRASMYMDLSNFIGEFRNLLMLGEFRGGERYVRLAKFLALIVYNLFVEINYIDFYNIKLIPFRLYCYGSYTGAEREAFNAFKERLKSLRDVEIYLVERSRGEREKGIDVRLAVDMLVHAAWNNYDVAILVSGDADFEPLVRRVRDLGKKVYITFYPYAIAETLKDASDGLIDLRLETLVSKPLADIIINEFRKEFLNSVNRLVEELETRNYFKPLLGLGGIREIIKTIKSGIQSSDLMVIMKSLEDLHKQVSSADQQLKNQIPYKHYVRLTFKLMFYKEIIREYFQR